MAGGVAGMDGAPEPAEAAAVPAGVAAGGVAPVVGAAAEVIGAVGAATPGATEVAACLGEVPEGPDATFAATPIEADPAAPAADSDVVGADSLAESSSEDAAEHPMTPDNESAIHHENRFRIRLSYGLAVMPEPLSKPYASVLLAKFEVFSASRRVSLCQTSVRLRAAMQSSCRDATRAARLNTTYSCSRPRGPSA